MKTEALFGLIVLVIFSLWRVYDALRPLPTTEKRSLLWHGISWLLAIVVSGYVYYNFFGFSFDGWEPALWTAICAWWIADLIWNKINGQEWSYAGDGKGSFMEKLVMWISLKVKVHHAIVLHGLKLIVTMIAVFTTL